MRKLIADDKNLVVYRPSLRVIGGSIAGTVLLQQIIYWDDKSGGKFYKFSGRPSDPSNSPMYKDGDSWAEELGMSVKELRTALTHFAFKCGKKNKEKWGGDYEQARDEALVIYYTDANRITWYRLNRPLLYKLLLGVYKESDQPAITNTETTTETTTYINYSLSTDKSKPTNSSKPTDESKESFERIWLTYDKKVGKPAAFKYWSKLTSDDRAAIEKAMPAYIAATPDKKFRKNLQGWINPANRMWEDEVVPTSQTGSFGSSSPAPSYAGADSEQF